MSLPTLLLYVGAAHLESDKERVNPNPSSSVSSHPSVDGLHSPERVVANVLPASRCMLERGSRVALLKKNDRTAARGASDAVATRSCGEVSRNRGKVSRRAPGTAPACREA